MRTEKLRIIVMGQGAGRLSLMKMADIRNRLLMHRVFFFTPVSVMLCDNNRVAENFILYRLINYYICIIKNHPRRIPPRCLSYASHPVCIVARIPFFQ